MKMKMIGTSLLMMFLCLGTATANDFGSYGPEVDFEQNYDDSMKAIKASRELRKSLVNDRSIAGMSSSDEKWSAEFDRIMADNRTDYLKMALKLED